jgi:hypothetical protein
MKTGIFILIDISRKECLKTTLYFLFKNYNETYKHPVYLMHRTKLTELQKEEILLGIRENSRNLVSFWELSNDLFESNINEQQLTKTLNMNPILDWGDKKDRQITFFWTISIWDLLKDWDYIMKMDDDTLIEEPIKEDFFKIVDVKNFNILFNMLKVDCGISNFGLKDYLQLKFDDKKEEIDNYFNTSKITDLKVVENFKQLFKIITSKEYNKIDIDLNQPIVCIDTFYVTKPSFWLDSKMQEILKQIDQLGYIFYYKWSLSSIISLLTMVVNKDKITRCIFRMSNKKNREAYIDKNNIIRTSVPSNYILTGCMTSK